MKIVCSIPATTVIFAAVAFLFLLAVTGCTELERDGMSPIPQNYPASWDYNPYGTDAFKN